MGSLNHQTSPASDEARALSDLFEEKQSAETSTLKASPSDPHKMRTTSLDLCNLQASLTNVDDLDMKDLEQS
jgi:hypothetical protein